MLGGFLCPRANEAQLQKSSCTKSPTPQAQRAEGIFIFREGHPQENGRRLPPVHSSLPPPRSAAIIRFGPPKKNEIPVIITIAGLLHFRVLTNVLTYVDKLLFADPEAQFGCVELHELRPFLDVEENTGAQARC